MSSSFLIDPDLPLGGEVRRVLFGQANRGLIPLEIVGPTEQVVHEARKASKRARAVGHLVRPLVGKSTWRSLDRGFRDAARILGPLRDADVVRKKLGDAAPPRPDSDGLQHEAAEAYRVARARAEALELDAMTTDDIVRGLSASWRAAREQGEAAEPGDPESFHEWRKSVKRLYYQSQLVCALQPAVLGGLAKQLDVLQESLGDHHDTVVAAEMIGHDAEALHEIEARRAALEAQTVPLGRWLLAASPKRFTRWLTATLQARRV